MTGNPLVAPTGGPPADAWAGVWIAEDIEQISRGVSSGSWIDATLGSVGAGLDVLAVVSDPVSALLQYGIAWIIEHVQPLSQALDALAGNPGQIQAHAQTWRNIAASLSDQATGMSRAVVNDLGEWTGLAANAYRVRAKQLTDAIGGLASAAEAMASITEAAGVLIAGVRMMVRDAIAACVSRLIVYAAEEAASFGLATPLVVEQVTTTVAAWAARIGKWLRALLSSLHRLQPIVRRLGELIDELKKLLTRLTHRTTGSASGGGDLPPRRPAKGPAATRPIGPPHDRHNLNRISGSSRTKNSNTVIMPGTNVAGDLKDIRAGNAEWNPTKNCYEVNGRTYGVEPNGTVYPIAGPGFVQLSRSAYKVLKQCIVSEGDVDAARTALARDPSVTADDWRAALAVFKYHDSYRGGA